MKVMRNSRVAVICDCGKLLEPKEMGAHFRGHIQAMLPKKKSATTAPSPPVKTQGRSR